MERFVCECALRSIGERGNKPYPQEWRVREQQPPWWGQQPHAASLHHGLCLHEPCATRACSPHVPRPTKLLGEQGCIGWGACCGFAGHTVVLTLNGSHPGELHYKMAKGQCDTRGAWTSALHTPVPPTTHSSPTKLLGVALCGTPHTTSVWCGGGLHSTPPVEGRGPAALTLQWGHPPRDLTRCVWTRGRTSPCPRHWTR